MTGPDLRAGASRFLRRTAGSARIAAGVFLAAVVALVTLAGLHLAGRLEVPTLIFLILGIVTAYTGWDAWRERRTPGDD